MPTENRSTIVSVPPYIGLEPLVGRYYPALCRRCGWVGSSEELTEDDAQCTRDVGDRLCLGDCDELGRDDLLGIVQAMAKAAQHQGEPVVSQCALCCQTHEQVPVGRVGGQQANGCDVDFTTWRCEGCGGSWTGDPSDPGEVERLRAELDGTIAESERRRNCCADLIEERDALRIERRRMDEAMSACANERDTLRAELAERDALFASMKQIALDACADLYPKQRRRVETRIESLSASAEPSEECAHSYANGQGCPECGEAFEPEPVERDDGVLIDTLRTCEKWFIKHSPTAPLIGGFGDAEHPMLTCIRAALERKPQVKS